MISSIDPFKILISINPWTKVSKAILVNSIAGITEYKVVVNYSYIGTDMNRWKLEQLFVFEDNELTEITSPKEIRLR